MVGLCISMNTQSVSVLEQRPNQKLIPNLLHLNKISQLYILKKVFPNSKYLKINIFALSVTV